MDVLDQSFLHRLINVHVHVYLLLDGYVQNIRGMHCAQQF
jgi:hypothetical protein